MSVKVTKAAEEKNAENLLVIDDLALAKRYAGEWETHRGHSTEYHGR